jgi:hypothetical protein
MPFWGVILVWGTFYAVTHVFFLRSRALSNAQTSITYEGAPVGYPKYDRELAVRQGLFSLMLLAVAYLLGGPAYVFLAGGWTLAAGLSVGLTLNSMLFARALGAPGAADGSVKLSAVLTLRSRAAQLFGAGLSCICIAILVPHLALIGAAVFLVATGFGYRRQAIKYAHP